MTNTLQVVSVPKPAMTTRVFIAVISAGNVHVACAESLMACVTMKVADWAKFCRTGPYLDDGRNNCVREFLSEPFSECRFLLMVDSDIEFKPDDVAMLAGRNLPVVSGVYHSWFENGPTPVIYQFDDNRHFFQVQKWKDGWPWWPEHRRAPDRIDPLVRIGGFGGGFLMIRRDVLERLAGHYGEPQPWFAEDVIDGVHYGEDLCFAKRLDELGIPAYCDLRVQVTHHKTMPL